MIDLTKKKLLTPTTCTRKGKPQGRAVTAAVAVGTGVFVALAVGTGV